jgi:glycyl-tRNA synthetase beta chain
VLAVAERLDNLASGFGAGLKPSGNKDPFALRRNALGLARTLIEGGLDVPLRRLLAYACGLVAIDMADLPVGDLLDAAAELADKGVAANAADIDRKIAATYDAANADPALIEELHGFVLERLRGYYADQGLASPLFDAVAAVASGDIATLPDFDRRLRAIAEFAGLEEAPALAAANKRIRNILRKAEEVIPESVDTAQLREPAEQALAFALGDAITATDPLLAERDYVGVLRRLAALRAPVDAFFDGVMVMADDAALRRNRLALLKRLADRFAAVAAVEHLSKA